MNEERLDKLEKKVKRLEYINYIRFTILALTFLGVTAFVLNKIKKV